jgi:hypothetical protein
MNTIASSTISESFIVTAFEHAEATLIYVLEVYP